MDTNYHRRKETRTVSFRKGIFTALGAALLCLAAAAPAWTAGAVNDMDRPLVIGYSNQIFYNADPRDAIGLSRSWAQIADRKLKSSSPSDVVHFRRLEDVLHALKTNRVDIIILIAEEYMQIRDRVPLAPVLTADYGKHFYDELVLLVRADSGITRLEQLRRKNIRIESGHKGALPLRWLDSLLRKKVSATSDGFFAGITDYPKSSQVVMPLFFGQTDACLVSWSSFETMDELNPQIGRTLRILEKSPGFAIGFIAVRRDISNPRRDAMVEILRDMHNDAKGRQLLTLFHINRLVDFKPEHLLAVEKLLREHRAGIDSGIRRKRL